jgi:hypothetical protein
MNELKLQKIGVLSGVIFVALFGVGFIFATVLVTEPYPSPFGPPFGFPTGIERYFTNNRTQVEAMSFVYSLAALALLCFAAVVARVVRWAEGEEGVLSGLALGGGVMAAAFALLTALFIWVLARPRTVEEPILLHAMHDLAYLAGGPAHVLALTPFVGASALAMLNKHIVPRWISWMGIAAAVLSLLSVTALLWESATLLLPLARVITFVWISAISLVLAFGEPIAESRRRVSTSEHRRTIGG